MICLVVSLLVAGAAIVPPDEMEFRPLEAHGQPNRINTIGLAVNALVIPPGRKINKGLGPNFKVKPYEILLPNLYRALKFIS